MILGFIDGKEKNTTQLARRFIVEINESRSLSNVCNTPTKVQSLAWCVAFAFRNPLKIMEFTCTTCGVKSRTMARDMIEDPTMLAHRMHDNWDIMKVDEDGTSPSRPMSKKSLETRMDTLEKQVQLILQRLGQ